MRARHNVRRFALLSAATLVASGLPAVATPLVAHATANANVHLGSSVTSSVSNPVLGLSFVADRADVTPGDTITYTSKLTNSGSEWQVGGKITAQAVSSSDAVIASWYDELDYRDSSNRWVPIASYAAVRPGYAPKDPGAAVGGLTVAATAVTASGVTYPTTGDFVLGTAINASKTASWTYLDSVVLTAAQITALSHASGVRATVHLEVTPRNSNAAQPASDTESLSNPLQSGTSATITNASVTATLPNASTVTVDKTKVAALASIAAGSTVTATTTYVVPVPGVEKAAESDGTYLARLRALVGATLSASASAKGTAAGAPGCSGGDPGHHYGGSTHHDPTKPPATPAGAVATGIRTVSSTEHLPVLSLSKTGPATAGAGTTASYGLTVANAGDAAGASLAVVDTLPDGAKPPVTGLSTTLAAAGTVTGHASYAVPATQSAGPLADTATLTWVDANHNPYGPLTASYTTAVTSSFAGATLTLSPAMAGPDVVGTPQTLTAVLTDVNGAVLAGKAVTITVTGTNPTSTTVTTDAIGSARLTYTGTNAGDDTAQAKLVAATVASNTATIGWTRPDSPVSLTTVTGNFYTATSADQTFTATPASAPVFGQSFPDVAFNPPAGAVPGNITGVGPTTSPFTDLTTDVAGHGLGTVVASGNGQSAYAGGLKAFDAALSSTLTVAKAGGVTFRVLHSGGALVAIGGGAVSVNGAPAAASTSAMHGYPVVGGFGGAALDRTDTFTVNFPAAGSYPVEIDYFSTGDVRASLVLSLLDFRGAGGKSPALSVYTGYADTEDPAGTSTFPSPFFGSAGVSSVGVTTGPYDTGLIRLDNHTDSAVPVSSVTADIGTRHYAPWTNDTLSVPAQGSLLLGSTDGENFDTSDPNGTAPTAPVTAFNVSTIISGIDTHWDVGPVGMTMDPQGDFYFIDFYTGQLFEVPAGGDFSNPTPVGPGLGTSAAGLAFSPSGRLYYVQQNSGYLFEVDPKTGQILRPVLRIPDFPTGLALDPVSGDLFASHPGLGPVSRISGYETGAATWTDYGATSDIDGITFAPDGTLYGEQDGGNIVRISGTDQPQPPTVGLIANVPTADGVGLVENPQSPDNPNLIVNSNNGTITEVDTSTSPATQSLIYKDGTRGDLVATGTDGCLYATQTFTILKITAADGSCPFETVSCSKLSTVPRVTVTTADGAVGYDDTKLTLTDGGIDGDHCGNRNESSDWTQIGGPVGDARPVPPSGTLTLSPEKVSSATVGLAHPSTVAAMDADGQPVAGLSVDVAVTGTSTAGAVRHLTGVTDAQGLATVSYSSAHSGTDTLTATALLTGARVVSNTSTTSWVLPALPPPPDPGPTPTPTPTGGGGGTPPTGSGLPPTLGGISPVDGARILAPTPVSAAVTAPDGETITSWSVTLTSAGGSPIAVASGTGQPPATLGTLDPTLIADGQYQLTVIADASGGGRQTSTTSVIVDGNLKLGRFAATWHDTDASLGSTTLGMLRSYDSDVKASGDFGFGWTLSTSGIKVSTNGALGNGGWSSYDASCVFSLCTEGYRTTQPHVVVATFPDGHVESFDFTPTGAPSTSWLAYARFTARAGTTSTLTPVGDDNLLDQGDGSLYDEDSGDPYAPTQFVLTTHDGNKLLLDTTQGLVSFTNPAGITYTFTPTGVTSSAGGNTAVFTRDSTGRITDIKADGHTSYSYSAAGDLASVTDPAGAVTTFTYDGAHLLLSVNGPGNVPLRTMHYDTAGRLTSVTDADGNTTAMTDDVAARTQVIKDPNGKLTTTLHLDDLGDVLTKTAVGDGLTRTTTSTYDAFGRVLSSTDPLGHTTSRTYDDAGDLLSATDAAGHVRSITYGPTGQPLTTTDATGAVQQFSYDGSGELTSLTDANGHTTGYSYDAAGRMASKTDALGGTTAYAYDGAGRLTSTTDPLGRTTTTTYDSHGHVATSTDPAGLVTTTSYDPDGRLLSSTDPSGAVTSSAYDGNGRQTSTTDALGKVTSYAYTAAGLRSTSTDPLGRVTAFAYDADGRVTTTTDPTGAATVSAYDAFGELSSVKDPLGRVTGYGYDAAGERTSMTAANGKTTSYGFDVAGNRTSVTDPLGHVTTTGFDAMNRPTTVIDADGHVTKTAYLVGGQASAVTDPAGGVAKYVYDADNRVTSTTDALSETSSSVFDAAGQLTSSLDAAGRGSSSTYDGDGRLLTSTDGAGRVTSYAYDTAGRLATTTSPSGRMTSYGYDADGRQTSVTDNLGHSTATAYDADGETASTTDPNGHTTAYGYDGAGRMTSMTDALGGKVALGYDAAGQQTKVTDPDGVVHSYGYDALGDRSSVTDALGDVQSWVFDDAGQLKTAKNARGQVTTYSYDPAGQTTGWSSPDGTVSQGFDALGDRTSLTDATGASSYTYDAVGRMTGATTPAGTVSYGYDASGLRTDVTAAGAHVGYAYNGAGQLASVADASGTTSMGYNTDGDLASVTRPNGVATAYGYDAAGRLVKDDTAKGSTVVANIDYTLDAAGNRVGVTGPDGAQSYTLDADNRLTAATGGGAANLAYSYDAAGNRTSVTSGSTTTGYTYDAAGRLSKVGATAVSMDADGNLTTAGGDSYTYNAAGALTAASVGGKAATYTVNADGARVAVTTGGATSKLVLDMASDLPAVLAETGHRYTRDTTGGLLADTAGTTTSYAVTDAQGTIRALTSSTGAVTGTASYDPYGQLRSATGTATSFGYTGAATDVGGNVNLQAREYNPGYGQFLQADSYTIGGAGTTGYNHYTYTGDNPTTAVDSTGHDPLGLTTDVAVEGAADAAAEAIGQLAEQEARKIVEREALEIAFRTNVQRVLIGTVAVGVTISTLAGDDGSGGGSDADTANCSPDPDDTTATTVSLRTNLIKVLGAPPAGYQAHHIVSRSPQALQAARNILAKHNIDLDSPANGVFLPDCSNEYASAVHNGSHTQAYYSTVGDEIAAADRAEGKPGVLNALNSLKVRLASGNLLLN